MQLLWMHNNTTTVGKLVQYETKDVEKGKCPGGDLFFLLGSCLMVRPASDVPAEAQRV